MSLFGKKINLILRAIQNGADSKKKDFLTAANGHIIQYGHITGIYKRGN